MGHIPENFIQDVYENVPKVEDTGLAPTGFYKVSIGSISADPTWTVVNELEFMQSIPNDRIVALQIGREICQIPNLVDFMMLLHEKMADLGVVFITAPYWTSSEWANDFRNVQRITEYTFGLFSHTWCRQKGKRPISMGIDFELLGIGWIFEEGWNCYGDEAKKYAKEHYLNSIREIKLTLKTIKGR